MLYGILGFMPHNLKPYHRALTHSSFTPGRNGKLKCNERLEFLGDAVIASVTSDYLYRHYRKEREGFLSKSRSKIVCRESLNTIAMEVGLDKLMTSVDLGHQHNNYVYGNAFEAFVGAIYIDRGYDYCRRFLMEKVFDKLVDVRTMVSEDTNYKSRLLEWSQKEHHNVEFTLIKEEIRRDGSFFVSEVYIDGQMCGSGEGFSKRESHQKAAKEALQNIAC